MRHEGAAGEMNRGNVGDAVLSARPDPTVRNTPTVPTLRIPLAAGGLHETAVISMRLPNAVDCDNPEAKAVVSVTCRDHALFSPKLCATTVYSPWISGAYD